MRTCGIRTGGAARTYDHGCHMDTDADVWEQINVRKLCSAPCAGVSDGDALGRRYFIGGVLPACHCHGNSPGEDLPVRWMGGGEDIAVEFHLRISVAAGFNLGSFQPH